VRRLFAACAIVLVAACATPGPSTPSIGAGSPSLHAGASPGATPSVSPGTGASANWTALRWSAPTFTQPYEHVSDVVAWSGGYVAVGSLQTGDPGMQAATWSSPDWQTWTRTMLDVPASGWSSLANVLQVGAGLVAIGISGKTVCVPPEGEGQVCEPTPVAFWVTADGQHWAAAETPADMTGMTVDAVASNGRLLVLAGDTGWNQPAIWTTTDGATWQREMLPATFKNAHLSGLVAARIGFVLTGSTGGAAPVCCATGTTDTTPAAWFSTDGERWQSAVVVGAAAATGDQIGPVFAARAGLVAWSGQQRFGWASPDGQRWSALPGPAGNPVIPRASDGTRIVGDAYATGDQDVFAVSADGATWQALGATGAVEQRPAWSGSEAASVDAEFLFGDALGLIGQNGTTRELLWFAQAETGS